MKVSFTLILLALSAQVSVPPKGQAQVFADAVKIAGAADLADSVKVANAVPIANIVHVADAVALEKPQGSIFALGELRARERARDNLIVNGSFERRKEGTPNQSIEPLIVGSDVLVGWEVFDVEQHNSTGDRAAVQRIVEWIGPQRWAAADGDYCLDLDAGIRQVVPTTAGKQYVVRFDMAGNPESGPRVQLLTVVVDERAYPFDFDSTGRSKRDLGWTVKEIRFVASGDRTKVAFINALPNSQSAGVALDNVVMREAGEGEAGDDVVVRMRDVYRRMRRFEQEAEELRRAGRSEEADRHLEKAKEYRKQFEALLGIAASPLSPRLNVLPLHSDERR